MNWVAAPEGLIEGALRVSFQRYVRPASGRVASVPASLGALPVAASDATFLLPISGQEAFWIGLSVIGGVRARLLLTAEWRDGRTIRFPSVLVPPARVVAGVGDGHGYAVFDATLASLSLHAATARRVEVVGATEYAARTGGDPPDSPDPGFAYGGWRLP